MTYYPTCLLKKPNSPKERNQFTSDMKNMQTKLDEVSEDYENLMELTQTKQKRHDLLINDLNNVIINLMNDVKRVIQEIFQYFWSTVLYWSPWGCCWLKKTVYIRLNVLRD